MISNEYSAAKSVKASVSHIRRQNPWHITQDSNGEKIFSSSHGKSLIDLKIKIMKNSGQSKWGIFVYLGKKEKHNISLLRECWTFFFKRFDFGCWKRLSLAHFFPREGRVYPLSWQEGLTLSHKAQKKKMTASPCWMTSINKMQKDWHL